MKNNVGAWYFVPFQFGAHLMLDMNVHQIFSALQMIAGFSSAEVGAKSCSKFLNGSNLMESIPDFLGSLQSLIGISPALNMLAWSDGFNLNCDSLELSYPSVIEEDLELTLIMPIAWETMFLLIDAIFRSILSPTHWAPFTAHLEVESWHYLCHSHPHVICHHISWLQFIINHVNSNCLSRSVILVIEG